MKVALVGYGKMGRAIEAVVLARGHRVSARVDPAAEGARRRLDPGKLGGAEVAFEFTRPDAAAANVQALLEGGVRVVCGTTGWEAAPARIAGWARAGKSAAVWAPNFSVGVLLFQRIVADAAGRFAATGLFDPYVMEMHHRAKLDAPSGTAVRLADALADAWGASVVAGTGTGPVPAGAVHVASVRAGQETGSHTVGFEGAYDSVTLTHRARSREGFALGAVLAAEWIRKRKGVHGMDAVLDDMVAARGRKGGRR